MNLDIKQDIIKFLNRRPDYLGAFGYGSGVYHQNGYKDKETPQVDIILAVDNTKKWHSDNIKANPKDYSITAKIFFGKCPSSYQEIGAKICYLTYLKDKDINRNFKLGIIEKKWLMEDLINWDSFYLAGRFQKPIEVIKTDEDFNKAIISNRCNALKTAKMLLADEQYCDKELFQKICSLSYLGDTRMGIAENPNKVENIVGASFEIFKDMYNNISCSDSINELPLDLREYLLVNNCNMSDLLRTKELLYKYFITKNGEISKLQTIKGLLTNGPIKSYAYGMAKIKKCLTKKR